MPKSLIVDPDRVRARGTLTIAPIPLNQYSADLDRERRELGDMELAQILSDMVTIRAFESMLDAVKREGVYRNIRYVHQGPAHLSIGQEAAAAGQAAALDPTDLIFGSHRSHGEVIAKGLQAVRRLAEDQLSDILDRHLNGGPLRVLEKHIDASSVQERARQYLLYGLLAEIFGRSTGYNRGMGGSMHAFFPPFGICPNNAIVGGSAPIATGAALYKRLHGDQGIVIANIGDASTGCGPVWESMNFAAMSQFSELFEDGARGGLPVIFFFVNNFYGMGGQTIGETMAFDHLARIGAAFNQDNMHAETIDGTDPLAVRDAVGRARAHLLGGLGPVLLDCQTYRYSGHSPSDASSYRTREEVDLWRATDPVTSFAAALTQRGIVAGSLTAELTENVEAELEQIFRLASDQEISPRLDVAKDPDILAHLTYSNTEIDLDQAPRGQTRIPLQETGRAMALARKSRSGITEGTRLPGSKAIQFRDALFEAIAHHAVADDRLVIYGEENRDWDGAFGVYRGLTELLPYRRLFNAPISEAAIIGTAVGYAMAGGRALVELMYADFMGRAGDELFNQLAKWHAMSGGLTPLPVVVRISVGSKYGAQHSQDWSTMAAHVPGLKVVFPATPYDAKGLMASALSGNDPVVFFESQRLYDTVEIHRPEGVPAEYYRIPLGAPHTVKEGSDITILSLGAALTRALEAAATLEQQHGLTAQVIDARTLVPFDPAEVVESVRRTGRLILVSDACTRGSFLHTLATELQALSFTDLDAPVTVVGARNTITPPAEMEDAFFPTARLILETVHERILPLPGFQPDGRASLSLLAGRSREGL